LSSGDVWVIAPLLCLAAGAFGVYLIARLVTHRNEILALCTALVFGAALVCLAISLIFVPANPFMAKSSNAPERIRSCLSIFIF
jgi:hypothetical protein